jgi:hypothetical protein
MGIGPWPSQPYWWKTDKKTKTEPPELKTHLNFYQDKKKRKLKTDDLYQKKSHPSKFQRDNITNINRHNIKLWNEFESLSYF